MSAESEWCGKLLKLVYLKQPVIKAIMMVSAMEKVSGSLIMLSVGGVHVSLLNKVTCCGSSFKLMVIVEESPNSSMLSGNKREAIIDSDSCLTGKANKRVTITMSRYAYNDVNVYSWLSKLSVNEANREKKQTVKRRGKR